MTTQPVCGYCLSLKSSLLLDSLSGQAYGRMLLGMPTKPKRPRDPNQLAKLITGIATGDVEESETDDAEDRTAVALGLKGA
jgi:hypothetical protein